MLYTRENDVLPKTIAGKENAKAYFTTLTMDLSRLTMDLSRLIMNLRSVKRDIIKPSSACRYLLVSVHL